MNRLGWVLVLSWVGCGGADKQDPASEDSGVTESTDGSGDAGASGGGSSGDGSVGEGGGAAGDGSGDGGSDGGGSGDGGTDGGGSGDDGSTVSASAGCGLPAAWLTGGAQIELDAGADGDGVRGAYLVLPSSYDPNVPHRLVFGFPGTNWVGQQIRGYLNLEGRTGLPEVYVYPDPLWREFSGWGTYGGWVLGPHAWPADGMGDLVFTEKLLDHLEDNLCIDTERVFATGHSWGGDMAQVVACFLGDRFTASAPAAANQPYWFTTGGGWTACAGDAAVWTWFGINDTHFTMQSYPGEYGDQCNDFWLDTHSCDESAATDLGFEDPGTCVSYGGCDAEVRYCLYGADAGHGIPSYYSGAVMDWFATF